MSVSYFTKIVYGVRLENDEINVLMNFVIKIAILFTELTTMIMMKIL